MLLQSSLSSVSPPDIWYHLKLPQEVIDSCQLSALQLEAVTYACQQHETFLADGRRAGFLIGKKQVLECALGLKENLSDVILHDEELGLIGRTWSMISSRFACCCQLTTTTRIPIVLS